MPGDSRGTTASRSAFAAELINTIDANHEKDIRKVEDRAADQSGHHEAPVRRAQILHRTDARIPETPERCGEEDSLPTDRRRDL